MSDELNRAIARAAKSINKSHEYVEGWRSRAASAAAVGNKKVEAFRLDSADYLEEMAASTAALIRLLRANDDVARLREALAPFAACAEQLEATADTPRAPDGEWAKFRLLTDDYRRAAAAMSATTPTPELT